MTTSFDAETRTRADVIDLVQAGNVQAAVDTMARAGSPEPLADVSRVQLKLRQQAFAAATASPASSWPPAASGLLAERGVIPEVDAADLDLRTLTDGVIGSGSLIVRGLLSDERSAQLRDRIDRVMAARAAIRAGERSAELSAWYERFDPEMRTFVGDSAAYVIDSPRMALELGALYQESGITDLIADYIGERPSVSLRKWVLRRVPSGGNTGWHQDGNFLGRDTRNMNLWISLSHSGETAPGLDVVPFRIDEIVESGTGDAAFDWSVGSQVVEQWCEGKPWASPVFAPGDAVFFDHMCLHRTGMRPEMTDTRYAIETWFFSPSFFPEDYTGFLL